MTYLGCIGDNGDVPEKRDVVRKLLANLEDNVLVITRGSSLSTSKLWRYRDLSQFYY